MKSVVLKTFSTILVLILISSILSVANAQQQSTKELPLTPHIQKKIEHLKDHGIIPEKGETGNQTMNRRKSGVDFNSIGEAYTVFEQDQSWNRNPNPNPAYNFELFEQGQPAGNVNGDSLDGNPVDDFIVTGIARDERTDALEDRTWKTAVFFGGDTSGTPDQVFYRKLEPVGDLNGDGYADAVALETNLENASNSNQPPYIYKGTPNGFEQTSYTIDDGFDNSNYEQVAFHDFNRDGYDDVLSYFPDGSDNVLITWGKPLLSDVSYVSYSFTLPAGPRNVVVEDVDGDTLKEMVSLNGSFGDGQIQVAKIDTTAESDPTYGIYGAQQFAYNSFTDYADEKDLHLLDINGSGYYEIYISDGRKEPKYIVEYDSANSQYFTTESEFFDGSLVPAGDLNNDGNHDFIQGDSTDNYSAHISYGPDDLTQDLALDVDLNGNNSSDWTWEMGYNRYSNFGDLDGDGIDDALLSHTENNSGDRTLGRRIIEGSEAETFNSVFHEYAFENFRSGVASTQNVGDLNGDGIDDLALALRDQQKVEIYYGAESISGTPDKTLNLNYFPLYIEPGDFDGDGENEIGVMGYHYISSSEAFLDIYNADGSKLFSIKTSDFQNVDHFDLLGFFNIGDINNDGVDDFATGSSMAHDTTASGSEYLNEAYIFYGGGTISNAPDVTISLGNGNGNYIWAGERAISLGDMNGDGIDDFAISAPGMMNPDETMGQVQVFYGGKSGDYASPDVVLTPDDPSISHLGWAMDSGDFNGDDINDIAAAGIYSGNSETEAAKTVQVYNGSASFDSETDRYLTRPQLNVNLYESTTSFFNFFVYGTLETIPDFTNNGKDELLFTSSFGDASHAVIYTFNSVDNTPEIVLKAPNTDAGLGAPYNTATGDFNDNGKMDLVLTQLNDHNDAYISSRIYQYQLSNPIIISSVEDVPEDQGEWIRVSVDGYLMDAMSEGIYGFDSWAVRRMEEDSSWTSVATVKPYSEGSKFVDVRVPKTQPTDTDTVDNTYKFKVLAYHYKDDNTIEVLAETAVDSGRAYDNIAPEQVSNLAISDQTDKTVSWSATNDNDVGEYEVYEVGSDGQLADEAIGRTPYTQTNFALPDNIEGVQNFSVLARDVNNNAGPASETATAVYPQTNRYEFSTGWNLMGIPVDADPDSVQKKLHNASASGIFEYSGGYTKVSNVEPGKGYWVKFSSDNLKDLWGLPVTELTLDLEEGWNLVSGVGDELPLALAEDSDGILLAETLYEFDESYTASDTLRPGDGYWVRASASGTVTFRHPKLLNTADNTSSKKDQSLAKSKEDVEESFGKITVKHSDDSRTLYFGGDLSEQVDKRNYSLPPLPPGDVFDARFDDDMRLSEEEEVTILLSRKEGVTLNITLDTENLIEQTKFLVKEYSGGEVLTEYTVTGDESFDLKYSETTAISLTSATGNTIADQEIPEKFKLEQNYPNPFNPTTQIKYAITEQANVTLEVFNILGRKVATLVNSDQQPGNYQVTFDGSNLASGVYLYRLQAGSKVSTKKFILAK